MYFLWYFTKQATCITLERTTRVVKVVRSWFMFYNEQNNDYLDTFKWKILQIFYILLSHIYLRILLTAGH